MRETSNSNGIMSCDGVEMLSGSGTRLPAGTRSIPRLRLTVLTICTIHLYPSQFLPLAFGLKLLRYYWESIHHISVTKSEVREFADTNQRGVIA